MSKLTLLQAFAEGRVQVPGYSSGSLLKTKTRKGRDCWWDDESESWAYAIHGDDKYLPADYKPIPGEACFLGAVGLAMGADLRELVENDSFYAHPDFYVDKGDRKHYPRGFVYHGHDSDGFAALKKETFPCTGHGPSRNKPYMGTYGPQDKPIPEVIAHLNDSHDPRVLDNKDFVKFNSKESRDAAEIDPWPESRIVEWLRSLGYNGDH